LTFKAEDRVARDHADVDAFDPGFLDVEDGIRRVTLRKHALVLAKVDTGPSFADVREEGLGSKPQLS
jgi:hypothetical protein